MKRKTLDLILSIGGIAGAVLVLVLGLVLQGQATFAKDYTATQLGAQQIFFTPADKLNGEDKAPGGACLVTYATQQMLTGKQAECYANQYIAFHMAGSAERAGYPGATYASLGGVTTELRTAATTATEALTAAQSALTAAPAGSDTTQLQAAVDAAQITADEATAASAAGAGLRDTMFKGESLRGLLLTVYGFSVFGDLASQAALVCFLAAGVLLLLSLAGFVHGLRTPEDKVVFTA